MYENSEKPNIEEQYQTAGNTSDLTVEADRRGAGDVLVGAGMIQLEVRPFSEKRIGMALLRLHSEWGACAKPKRLTAQQIAARADQIKRDDLKAYESERRLGPPRRMLGRAQERAQAEAERWFASELRLLANSLKSRPVVWEQLSRWLAVKGIHADTVAAALLHWLDPSCRVCDGHGLRKVPDQPALSARQCHKCHGTGHVPHPQGSAQVLGHLDYCVQVARQSLKARLRRGD